MWPHSDHPIPAPASWSRTDAHAGMDDMGEHALRKGRLTVGELDEAVARKIAEALEQTRPLEAASACSEFLTPNDTPRRRPTRAWAAVVLFSVFAALARSCA